MIRERKLVADIQKLDLYDQDVLVSPPDLAVWHSLLGLGILLLNINIITKHQCPTRPLCAHDGSRQKKTIP